METSIHVYADWVFPDGPDLPHPKQVGTLVSEVIRNKELFSFSYSTEWLNSSDSQPIDPDLQLYQGRQFSNAKNLSLIHI